MADDGYVLNVSKLLLNSLTKACKLENDSVKTRLPIQRSFLEVLLFEVERKFLIKKQQPYLDTLYKTIFIIAYYGMLRISELVGIHAFKAKDIHVANNKQKILILLYSSKTHTEGAKPQKIKISLDLDKSSKKLQFSPFELTQNFGEMRGDYDQTSDQFFIFRDGSRVKPAQVRKILKNCIKNLGLNPKLYGTHSFRIGRATDLERLGTPVETIKLMGRWRSNTVFKYIHSYH